MSYYIAPASDTSEMNGIVIYTVVKRLKDFKPEEDKKYTVFKSKKEMETSLYVPTYVGKNGKLVKSPTEFFLRF